MSKIIITETEQPVVASFDATEGSVLVPLLVTNASTEVKSKVYSSVADFRADYSISTDGEYGVYTLETSGDNPQVIVDPTYYMIIELLTSGLLVVVKPISGTASTSIVEELGDEEVILANMAKQVSDAINGMAFEEFRNKNLFNIKYITSGAHANVIFGPSETSTTAPNVGGCFAELASIATSNSSMGISNTGRGDCIALVELSKDTDLSAVSLGSESIFNSLFEDSSFNNAACFYPGGTFTLPTAGETLYMPASFGYLMAMASSVKVNPDWLAVAGVSRGRIPYLLETKYDVGEKLMHQLQGDFGSVGFYINPIMKVGNYGLRIWGNKVLHAQTGQSSYRSYLNVKMLVCDISKQIYESALRNTFEPNDDITWINFKKSCNTLLDRMVTSRGLSWYSWKKDVSTEKGTLKGVLTIKPIEAIDSFEVGILLTEEGASVTIE